MNKARRTGRAARFMLATVGSAAFGPKRPKPPQSVGNVAELEAYIDELVEFGAPPGMSVAVVKDGAIAYERAFGLSDGPNDVAATAETAYQWMSMSKMPTAVAIFQLQERGSLSIDDEVTEHLPFFEVRYPSADSEKVTIRHLLNHSSGLSNPASMLGLMHMEGEPYPDQRALAEQVLDGNDKLKFEPGTRGTYTNLGYLVLGAIVEAVSAQTHRQYVREHIFGPLGMGHTDYVYSEEMSKNAAVGSQPEASILSVMLPVAIADPDALVRETVDGRMWFKRGHPDFTGAAGVIGPTGDLARFVLAFLEGGEIDGMRILSPESVEMMTNDGHIAAKGGPASFYKGVEHGLGWWVWPDGERIRIMHSGDGPGFSNIMQLYPEEHLGVIVQGNEWAYGVAFRGTSPRDSVAHLAASMDW
jgi:CubicO group peptidase (beta-lactamase class C family)